MRRAAWAAVLVVLGGASGCFLASLGPSTCDRSEQANPPVRYSQGTVTNGVYMSAPWDGELLWFPGGMHYAIEHKLGEVPTWWQLYLSFDQYGVRTLDDAGKGGVLAQSAGDQAEVRHINADTMTVVNGTCADFWLLVVAGTGSGPPDAGVADASSD